VNLHANGHREAAPRPRTLHPQPSTTLPLQVLQHSVVLLSPQATAPKPVPVCCCPEQTLRVCPHTGCRQAAQRSSWLLRAAAPSLLHAAAQHRGLWCRAGDWWRGGMQSSTCRLAGARAAHLAHLRVFCTAHLEHLFHLDELLVAAVVQLAFANLSLQKRRPGRDVQKVRGYAAEGLPAPTHGRHNTSRAARNIAHSHQPGSWWARARDLPAHMLPFLGPRVRSSCPAAT